MTVRDLGAAITAMARPPHPRTRVRHWLTLAVVAIIALAVGGLAGATGSEIALFGGLGVAIAALFIALGRLLAWCALALGLGFGLGTVPLFNVLGLEHAIAVALFASVMAGDLGAALARQLARTAPAGLSRAIYPGRAIALTTLAAVVVSGAITLVPGVIAALRGIAVPTCDWPFGILCYLALPLASAALFAMMGHAVGIVVGPRRIVGAVLAQAPALVIAGAALARFYSAPPVYTYNAILGYFPGNLYDENVALSAPLAWSRLEQLAWAIGLLAVAALRLDVASYRARLRAPRPAGVRWRPAVIAPLAAAVAIGLRCAGGTLGFAVDADDMEDALGGRIETAHFIIHYAKTPEIEADIALIAADHEFRYDQVTAQLGVAPSDKIVSFYFADREEKYRLHGSRDVEMAKPWRREIYLEHRSFPHSSLRHEIAHVVAAEFGDPLLGVAMKRVAGVPVLANPGLIEGLAVATAWPDSYDRPTPHESVRAIQALGSEPSLDTLFGLSFFSVSSAHGYVVAGSFLRFLLDRYGPEPLRAVYRNGGDFAAAYGRSRGVLEGQWRDMLAALAVPPELVESQRERFRVGSVFSRPCPHAIAKARERALEQLATGDRLSAIAGMRDVCVDSLGEPRYLLDLARMLATGGDDEQAEASAIWTALAFDPIRATTSLRGPALERLATNAATAGDLARARALLGYARALPLDLDQRRQLDAMAFAIDHRGRAGDALRRYFFPAKKTADTSAADPLTVAEAAAAAEPELGFAHYLVGLQRANRGHHAKACDALAVALDRQLPGPAFVKNAARRLALAAYRAHDTARLDIAIARLTQPAMASGDRLLGEDWRARVAFDRAH